MPQKQRGLNCMCRTEGDLLEAASTSSYMCQKPLLASDGKLYEGRVPIEHGVDTIPSSSVPITQVRSTYIPSGPALEVLGHYREQRGI